MGNNTLRDSGMFFKELFTRVEKRKLYVDLFHIRVYMLSEYYVGAIYNVNDEVAGTGATAIMATDAR